MARRTVNPKRSLGHAPRRVVATVAQAVTLAMLIALAGILPGLHGVGATANAQTLPERTYNQIQRAQELMGDERYDDSARALERVQNMVRSDYEKAVVAQTFGYLYSLQDRLSESIPHFRRAIELGALPEGAELQLQFNLGQIYMAEGQFEEGARLIEDWMNKTPEEPQADAHILLANAYAQLNQYDRAIPEVKIAIEKSEDPKESWYQLLLAMHYQREEFRAAADVLRTMIQEFPGQGKYWDQLSGIYLNLEEDNKALALLELAYKQGYLTSSRELLQLVNMYLFMDIPFRAARLLDTELEQGRIPREFDHLELLANAWSLAQEKDEALDAFSRAAELSDDGNMYIRIASIYVDKEEWSKVVEAIDSAFDKGGLDKPGKARLLQGIAYAEQGQYENARRSLRLARDFSGTETQARQWLKHINELQQSVAAAS